MSTPVRLVGFVFVVVLGLGGGYAVGAAVGPLDTDPAPAHLGDTSTVPTTSTIPTTTTGHEPEHGS